MRSKKYWVALSLVDGLGSIRLQSLLKHFGTPEAIWQAKKDELMVVYGIGPALAEAILKIKKEFDIEKFLCDCQDSQIKILTYDDPFFPENLKEIFDPPPVLYYYGELKKEDRKSIAVVGSRKMTSYGARVTRKLVRDLVEEGFTIISGMAIGIDSVAHQAALEAQGRTIAVLGSGVDVIYPPENKKLYLDIISNGAIISTYPPGTKPEKGNFPARNRIISGLAYGTLVIEAGKKSGALITAHQALEQNREVFAVPGSIFNPMSEGTNYLIKNGAHLVDSINDIVQELYGFGCLSSKKNSNNKRRKLSRIQAKIVSFLEDGEKHVEDILEQVDTGISDLNIQLLELEVMGIISQCPGQKYTLK